MRLRDKKMSWFSFYISSTLAFTAAFFFHLSPLVKPQLLWEVTFYWCMIFAPPMMLIDSLALIVRSLGQRLATQIR